MRRKFDVCPLGCECETIKQDSEGQYISTCHWYVEVMGKNPQSEERISDWRCALTWMPVIGIENSQTNRGQTAAIEEYRTKTLKNQADLATILMTIGHTVTKAIENTDQNNKLLETNDNID